MAIKRTQRGFALLIAVIFMSVMLSFGLALGSLGYKQQVLASSAIESQYAFYAADAALECALFADQQLNTFAYTSYNANTPPSITCDGATLSVPTLSYTNISGNGIWVSGARLSLDNSTRCADITIYKNSGPVNGITTYILSQGYDVKCSAVGGNRFVSRGIGAHY